MKNEENIGHIVRDKCAITSLRYQEKYLLSVNVIQHLSREKNIINFFLQVIIKFYF